MFVCQFTSCYVAPHMFSVRTCAIMANNFSEAAQAKGVEELPTAQHISHK